MALARVITSSDACARELTSALIDYGYTVEVVAPDSAPPHAADLELRVDSSPGDSSANEKLVASVRANVRNHSASLNFVHQLKPATAPAVFELPVPFVEAAVPVSDSVPFIRPANLESAISVVEPAVPIEEQAIPFGERDLGWSSSLPEDLPEAEPFEPKEASAPQEALAVVPVSVSLAKVERFTHRSSGNGLGACALALAAVVLPAALLVLGARPREISAKSLGMLSRAAAIGAVNVPAPVKETTANFVAPAQQYSSQTNAPMPSLVPNQTAAKPVPTVATNSNSEARVSVSKHPSRSVGKDTDYVARNTVTYLDERYRPVAKSSGRKKMAHSHHPAASGRIAANTPKKTKQTSN